METYFTLFAVRVIRLAARCQEFDIRHTETPSNEGICRLSAQDRSEISNEGWSL
jgi:hypothetical protein